METLAAIPIVVFFLVLVTTLVGILGGRATKLVLKKLVARESPTDEITPVIELVGRQQGIIPFLLTLFGLSPNDQLQGHSLRSLFQHNEPVWPSKSNDSAAERLLHGCGCAEASELSPFCCIFH